MSGLLDALVDGVHVERSDGADVDHLGRDAVLGQVLRGLHGEVDADRVRHDRDILSGALDLALADGEHEVLVADDLLVDVEGDAVHQLVLQEDDGVGVTDGGLGEGT